MKLLSRIGALALWMAPLAPVPLILVPATAAAEDECYDTGDDVDPEEESSPSESSSSESSSSEESSSSSSRSAANSSSDD